MIAKNDPWSFFTDAKADEGRAWIGVPGGGAGGAHTLVLARSGAELGPMDLRERGPQESHRSARIASDPAQ